MGKITLSPKPRPFATDLFFAANLLEHPAFAAAVLSWPKKGALIADEAIAERYGTKIGRFLAERNLEYPLLIFPGGESSKTREMKQWLEEELLGRRLGRDGMLIALGGGVTTDLVGFLASTYMRGIPVVYIPTTLLGMVDAAIGGKTGVDTPHGKNLIGSFYPPKEIFIDIEFLGTLPEKEWRNGLAEILKYGLIANEPHWKRCEERCLHWKEKETLERLIMGSIETKVGVVEMDPDEKGYRRILNFGHTIGHALEHLSHYQIPHGEAVAIGCMAESYLSHKLGYLPTEALERILHLYKKFGFSEKWPLQEIGTKAIQEAMILDKKSEEGAPRFVLLDQIGHCVPFEGAYCTRVAPKDLEESIHWMAR